MFSALPSNVQAVEAALLFANGLATHVALSGPSGWGKTHLLESAAQMIGHQRGIQPIVQSALEIVADRTRPESPLPLLIDDAQVALGSPRARQQLRLTLERRMRAGRQTLLAITSDRPSRACRMCLPHSREWTIGAIEAPSPKERVLVVRSIAEGEGMQLAEGLIKLLASKGHGNGRSIVGAMRRLRLTNRRWNEPGAVLKACGLLVPYFADHSGWDLRDHTHEVISGCMGDCCPRTGVSSRQMSIYLMLKLMDVSEEDVASFYGVAAGDVYTVANQVATLERQGVLGQLPDRCIQSLLKTLETV